MSLIADIHNDMEKGAVRLITEYRARLISDAVRICENITEAEDLVDRTFVKVIRNIESHHEDRNLYGWMKTIMVNIHRNDLAHPVARGTVPVDAETLESHAGADWSTDEEILRNSDSEAIHAAIKQLSPKYQEAILMRYYDEMSVKEIAAFLGKPIGTVCRRIQIAHRLLAGKLAVMLGRGKKPLAVVLVAFLSLVSAAAVATLPAFEPLRATVASWFGSDAAQEEDIRGGGGGGDVGGVVGGVGVSPAQTEPEPAIAISNEQEAQETQPQITQPQEEKQTMKLAQTFAAAALAATTAVGDAEPNAVDKVYSLINSDSKYTSSFDGTGECAGWKTEDGDLQTAPMAGNGYVVKMDDGDIYLRTYGTVTFAGDWLRLDNGNMNFFNSSVTVPNLQIVNIGRLSCEAAGVGRLYGNCCVKEDATFVVRTFVPDSDSRTVNVYAKISGTGTVSADPYINTSAAGAIKSAYGSTFGPESLGSFKGIFRVSGDGERGSGAKFLTTIESLPAEPDVPLGNGVEVDNGATLRINASGTIGERRGMSLNGNPVIDIPSGHDVAVSSRVTAPAGFVKDGGGQLTVNSIVSEIGGSVTVKGGLLIVVTNATSQAINVVPSGGAVLYRCDSEIVASVTGGKRRADGTRYGIDVSFSNPKNGEGCAIAWSVDGGAWSDTAPTFVDPGSHTVGYRITRQDYIPQVGEVTIDLIKDPCVYVSRTGSNEPPYDSPSKAAQDLQSAIDAVSEVELEVEGAARWVHVAEGAYALPTRATAKDVNIIGCKANFSGAGLSLEKGILSGCAFAAGPVSADGSTVSLKDAMMRGCRFTGLKGNPIATSGSCQIEDCEIVGGSSAACAVFVSGELKMTRVLVSSNTFDVAYEVYNNSAGALFLSESGCSLEVRDSTFAGNRVTAGSFAAPVVACATKASGQNYTEQTGEKVSFDRCKFSGNTGRTGFIRLSVSDSATRLVMRNCLIDGCESVTTESSGAASVFMRAYNGQLDNCTFVNCRADYVMFVQGSTSSFLVRNCIIHNLLKPADSMEALALKNENNTKLANVSHSVVYPKASDELLSGASVWFDGGVKFVGPHRGGPEYSLAKDSFGRDIGDVSIWSDEPKAKDLGGHNRVAGGKIDLGCYQWYPLGLAVIIF